MDAIAVKLNKAVLLMTSFHVIKDDHVSCNSVERVAAELGTIPSELLTSLTPRLPRVYIEGGRVKSVVRACHQEAKRWK